MPLIPKDVEILDNGAIFTDKGELDYFYFLLREYVGGRVYENYKVIRLFQLRSLPVETRRDTAVLQRMQEVLTGLYKVSGKLDFIHVAAGIFQPVTLGVVQMYGVAAMDEDFDTAVENSRLGFSALRSNMRGVYPQVRFRALDADMVAWLNNAFRTFRYATSTVGHPDPREEDGSLTSKNRKGQTAGKQQSKSSYGEHQNEKFFRSMAAGKHEFLWEVIATPVPPDELSRMLVAVTDDASAWKSREEGVKAINVGFALPMMMSQAVAHAAQTGYVQQFAQSHAVGVGQQLSTSQMHGTAHTTGSSHTDSTQHNIGVADSEGFGTSHTVGHSTSDSIGASHNWGKNQGEAVTHGTSQTVTDSSSMSSSSTEGGGRSWGAQIGAGLNFGIGASHGTGSGASQQFDNPVNNLPFGLGNGNWANWLTGGGGGGGHNPLPNSASANNSQSDTGSAQVGGGITGGFSFGGSSFGSESQGMTVGQAVSNGVFDSTTHSSGTSEGVGVSSGHGVSSSVADSVSHNISHTNSEGWGVGHADSVMQSDSVSDSSGVSKGIGRQVSDGLTQGIGANRGVSQGLNLGGTFGVVPSFGASRSHKIYDETARIIAEMLLTESLLLQRALKVGGWLSDVYTMTATSEAIAVVEAATGQAFGGAEEAVTRIQTRYLSASEQDHLRLHAMCFTPSTMREEIPGVIEAYRHTTLMDPLMVSTLASPAAMQLGDAQVIQERTPDFAFYPAMGRDVSGNKANVGFQVSTETGDMADTPVVLCEAYHTHTIFQGDPRMGKSEMAYRVALATWKWGNRVIVLEFGKGWNRFFNSPVPREHFELWQLQPSGVRPLRWAVLAVPSLIDPERYVTMVCENIAKSGQLGQVQIGLLQSTLRDLYVKYGALLHEDKVLRNPDWNVVTEAESARLSADLHVYSGQEVKTLTRPALQALAVLRSRKVSLKEWVDELERLKRHDKTTERERQALATVLFRLRELTSGANAKMFGALADDEDAVLIEQMGLPKGKTGRPGFVVIEGGDELGEFHRSFLLGLLACILYSSAKIQYAAAGGRVPYATEVFWEEANKVLSGPTANVQSSDSGGAQTSTPEQFVEMWRDGERYRFRNHPIVQTLSQLPPGIVPACNNGFFFRSKNPDDQKIILTYLARSPSGFVDQDYQRYLARMAKYTCIAKFGLTNDISLVEPLLMQALQVPMAEPTPELLARYYEAQS